MPRTTLIVQIFVASPADVSSERAILETVINQLNQVWSHSLGLTFELLKWETNIYPSFSSDPQTAINDQIGLNYDVFIGIFWGRIGTSTPRAESGTIEEFERAYKSWKGNKSPEIMLYFKDAPIAPSKIDTEQLSLVQEFKKSLSAKGGLYFDFEDQEGFESSVRAHLSLVAQKFSNRPEEQNLVEIDNSASIPTLVEEDDFGYIDYLEIYNGKLSEMNQALIAINEATERIGEGLSQRTIEINNQIIDAKSIRRFIKRAADDMSSYSDTLNSQVIVMSAARKTAFDALTNSLALRSDFNSIGEDGDLLQLKQSLESLFASAEGAKLGMQNMRGSADSLPRISKEINTSKRSMVAKIDLFLAEIESTQSTVSNIIKSIEDSLLESSRWQESQRIASIQTSDN